MPADAIAESDGKVTSLWYRWFYAIFQLLGSGAGAIVAPTVSANEVNANTVNTGALNAGTVTVTVDDGLHFQSQTDAAGAATGTLTNAPTAGDPAFWLRIQVNGINLTVPAWTA